METGLEVEVLREQLLSGALVDPVSILEAIQIQGAEFDKDILRFTRTEADAPF